MTNVTILTDDNGVKREYREVEREAVIGERVLIVRPSVTGGKYTKGDILTVDRYGNIGLPITNVGATVLKDEYVVLEPTDIVHVDGVRYREEEREAEVGESILIVAAEDTQRKYDNGSVQTVKEIPDNQLFNCVTVNEHNRIIYHREYVVLTPLREPLAGSYEPFTTNITLNLNISVASSSPSEILKAIVDSVQAELARFVGSPNDKETRDRITEVLTNKCGTGEGGAPVYTGIDTTAVGHALQKIRDNAIERTKADLVELRSDMSNVRNPHLRGRDDIYLTHEHVGVTVEFIVNKEKRTVVCLLRNAVFPEMISGRGIAKCAPDDCFNVHIGKAIALRRALGLDVPTEYLTVPQPTEVRVGDVVRNYGYSGRVYAIRPEKRTTGWADVGHVFGATKDKGLTFITDLHGKPYEYWSYIKNVEIIDDSRDQETEAYAVA
ncbi:hypothetical protein ABE354_23855 [Brevibacillus laterosporus]|uniref:hypothetical protein n=1 Tax=Brevibacillus laterosporus TaxID=1465 RepID=UPI003D1AA8D2